MIDGRWFEELRVGETFETGVAAVTADAVAGFAELSGDRNPLHLDDEVARGAGFPARIAHGVLGVAIATGLVNQLGLTRGKLLALLGLRWEFRRPVVIGDALVARLRVSALRATRRADRGVATLAVELINQRGEVVHEGELKLLLRRRPAPPA